MKAKLLLLALVALGTAIFFLARHSGAEEKEVEPAMVTKVYDLSWAFPTNDEPGDPLFPLEDIVPVFQSNYENPDEMFGDIKTLADWGIQAPGQMILTDDLKLVVRNTPAKIREFDRAMAALGLTPEFYDLRIALVIGEGCFAKLPLDKGFDAGLAALRDRGCEAKWITQVSLMRGRPSRLISAFSTSCISNSEPLIATFATLQDPVMRSLLHGMALNLTASEHHDAVSIQCELREIRLKGWRTSRQNDIPIDLPDAALDTLDRRLFFHGPGTQLVPYAFDGTPCGLLVELAGKTTIRDFAREVK